MSLDYGKYQGRTLTGKVAEQNLHTRKDRG